MAYHSIAIKEYVDEIEEVRTVYTFKEIMAKVVIDANEDRIQCALQERYLDTNDWKKSERLI